MSDYYPPGVSRLPDEVPVVCVQCSSDYPHDEFNTCPKCEENVVCPNCTYCHECEMTVDDMELEEDDMDDMVVLCPECNTDSSAEAWNEYTEEIWGDDITPVEDVLNGEVTTHPSEYWFACPACGETNVSGDKLKTVD